MHRQDTSDLAIGRGTGRSNDAKCLPAAAARSLLASIHVCFENIGQYWIPEKGGFGAVLDVLQTHHWSDQGETISLITNKTQNLKVANSTGLHSQPKFNLEAHRRLKVDIAVST